KTRFNRGKRFEWLCSAAALAAFNFQGLAATDAVELKDIELLLQTSRPSARAPAAANGAGAQSSAERPHFTPTAHGFVESISAAPGTEFPTTGALGQPEVAAKSFLKQHGKLLGINSPSVDFVVRKKNSGQSRHSIRFTQKYKGVPVFGGEVVVQVN